MGTLIAVYALICVGLILCFVGKFPGQILAYAGMLIAHFGLSRAYPIWLLVVFGILVVVSLIINRTLVPKLASKVYECGKAGKAGTVVGSILALIFGVASENGIVILVLLLALPYVMSFIFEFISRKNVGEGAKRAAGAYVVFLVSTLLNVAICAFCGLEVLGGWI